MNHHATTPARRRAWNTGMRRIELPENRTVRHIKAQSKRGGISVSAWFRSVVVKCLCENGVAIPCIAAPEHGILTRPAQQRTN
ncbi:MAG: hypothetical protein ACREIC_00200 [Limisphaerales bacterium]